MDAPSSFIGKTVAVFGAAGGWGQKFARTIAPHADRVLRVDPKLSNGAEPRQAIAVADSLFFAVTPDDAINEIIAKHGDITRAGQILLECSTTKRKITETLRRLDYVQGLSICSVHPMARSDLPSRGQNMLVMPIGKHSTAATEQALELTNMLEMTAITEIKLDQHGKVMSVVQLLDHVMQRAKISALNTQLQKLGIPLATIRRIATANARINELGTGRVGIQRPDVSASIIAEGLKDSDAWQIIEHVRDAMEMIGLAPQDELTQMLQEDINNFDPDGEWRSLMTARSTRVLEQMANLNLKGMRLYCPHDVSGLLENICRIFRRHGINLTAISSHVLQPEEGRTGVTFDIGLDEKCPFDVPALATDLEIIGVSEESF